MEYAPEALIALASSNMLLTLLAGSTSYTTMLSIKIMGTLLIASSERLTKTVSYFAGNGFEIIVLVAKMTCFSVPFARCSFAARYSSLVTISMNVSRLG